jgi:hypothetical protein
MTNPTISEIALQSVRNVGLSGVGLWRSTVESVKRRAVAGQFSADSAAGVARGTGARV